MDTLNKVDNMKQEPVKISINRNLANKLKSMQKVGESYSDVITQLLEAQERIEKQKTISKAGVPKTIDSTASDPLNGEQNGL